MGMCFVPDCKHYSERERCGGYSFPRTLKERKRWILNIRRKDRLPNEHSRVCTCHFVDRKKENGPTIFPGRKKETTRRPIRRKPSGLDDVDDPDWAPSLNMGYDAADVIASSVLEQEEPEIIVATPGGTPKSVIRPKDKVSVTPRSCIVRTCENNYPKTNMEAGVTLHRFPCNPYFQQLWLTFCGIVHDIDVSAIRICSRHFDPDSYRRNYSDPAAIGPSNILLRDAVPTLESPLDAECHITPKKIQELMGDLTDFIEPPTTENPHIQQLTPISNKKRNS